MEYVRVTNENLDGEHICCAISNNRDIQVASKKSWLSERFKDGLVFFEIRRTRKMLYRIYTCRKCVVSHRGGRLYAHKLFLGVGFV